MSLLVIAYPELEKKDFDWIQSVRKEHDERYYKVLDPHFTIVFPVFNFNSKSFINHIENASRKFKKFYFVLRCAQIIKDTFSNYTDVFLIPEEGYRLFVILHDALYTGPLAKELRLDIPFIPHIGIAGYADTGKCKNLTDKLNSKNIEIVGAINKLNIVTYVNDTVTTLHEIALD